MELKITASVKGATRRDEATGVYVSYCPTLHVYSQGKDETRARIALGSAVKLFLSSCLRNGTLDRVLKERGFSEAKEPVANGQKDQTGEFVAIERFDEAFEFEVPLYLLNEQEKRAYVD